MPKYYLKYIIDQKSVHDILKKNNCSNIILYIDIMSIARGFYNKNTLLFEIDYYITNNKQISNFFILELKDFLNNLYKSFRYYNPKFIIFFDNGQCKQNSDLSKEYKLGRSNKINLIVEDDEIELLRIIKRYYYNIIEQEFNKPKLSAVINLKEYEADFIPYYIINKNLINSSSDSTLNIILSLDKDLLQTCKFTNTIQLISLYKNKSLQLKTYYNENAIEYFYKTFKRGFLTAKHIPLMLALAGDKADHVDGIKGIGYAKAHDLIIKYELDPEIGIATKLPSELEPYRDLIVKNYNLINFESQITRIPQLLLSNVDNLIKEM